MAGAIVRKGGQVIQEESREWVRKHGPVPVGGVAVTSAGRLKAKYVIHAVGPAVESSRLKSWPRPLKTPCSRRRS